MRKFYFLFFLLIISNPVYTQNFSVQYFKYGEVNLDSPFWGNDILISETEPMGRMSGVEKSDGIIYLAVPDTNIYPGQSYGIIINTSTNHGANWSSSVGIHPAFICPKTKMIRTGLDSIECFFWYGTSIYNWNVINS